MLQQLLKELLKFLSTSYGHWTVLVLGSLIALAVVYHRRRQIPDLTVEIITDDTWFINRDLTFDIHYSYLNMTEFLNPVTNAKDPINAPRHKGGFKLRYSPSKNPYSVSLNYRYVDAFQWSSGIYFGNIASYGILDLHGSYRINKYVSAMLTMNNMLNLRHFEIMGGPKLGRMIVFRLKGSL